MPILSSYFPRRIHETNGATNASAPKTSLSASLFRAFQLPDDCVRGHTLVSMTGQKRVCIENFRGICSYTSEAVRLTASGGRICVSGEHLEIDCYTQDEIEITGRIQKVEFE